MEEIGIGLFFFFGHNLVSTIFFLCHYSNVHTYIFLCHCCVMIIFACIIFVAWSFSMPDNGSMCSEKLVLNDLPPLAGIQAWGIVGQKQILIFLMGL